MTPLEWADRAVVRWQTSELTQREAIAEVVAQAIAAATGSAPQRSGPPRVSWSDPDSILDDSQEEWR